VSDVPVALPPWPIDRGTRQAFADRFGETWARRFHAALVEGDPLADAVAALEGERRVEVGRQLSQGLSGGVASLVAPDRRVARLLREAESVPAHVDRALIASGPRAWYDVPFRLHLLSMSAGALVGLYTSPSIASVLSATGRLNDRTAKRLHDTARWLSTTMLPGSLVAGQAGHAATVRLRLVHARARTAARRHGHDEQRHGTAINQIDLVRTWLAFTLSSLRAQANLGFAQSDASIEETYGYWQQLAHLLGISSELVAGVRTHADAEQLEAMVMATSGPCEAPSLTLADRTLRTVAQTLDDLVPLPEGASRQVLETLARRFHGHERADALGLERSRRADALLAPVIALARGYRNVRGDQARPPSAVEAGRYADALSVAMATALDPPRRATSVEACGLMAG